MRVWVSIVLKKITEDKNLGDANKLSHFMKQTVFICRTVKWDERLEVLVGKRIRKRR